MSNPSQVIVDMMTDILSRYKEYSEDKCDLPIVVGFVTKDNLVVYVYNNCGFGDLRNVAQSLTDEAMLRMIALNEDTIERFREEDDNAK